MSFGSKVNSRNVFSLQNERGYLVWRQIVAYHLLLVAREDMGVERSLGLVFFMKGYFDETEHFRWYMSVSSMHMDHSLP